MRIVLYRFLPVVVVWLLSPAAAYAETITVVADRWCPYNCEPGAARPGLMIEIAQKAFAKRGIAVEYQVMPWTRAIEETRQRKYTAIVGASRKDAPDFIFPSLPQGRMQSSFYVRKGNPWRFTGIASLERVSLGVIADYAYNQELDAYIAAYKNDAGRIQMMSGDNALDGNVKKLLAGRINALVEGEYVVRYYLSKNEAVAKELEKAGSLPPSENDNLFIAFSPQEPKAREYANILTAEMQIMRSSGELEQILKAYSLTDWQK